jgi:hypothetical protein
MIETIIPNVSIDLAMGILLFGSIAFFHIASAQVFIVGIGFHLYNRDLFRWFCEKPCMITFYAIPVVVHYAAAVIVTAAVSSQINILDVFIISTIPIAIWFLWEMIRSKRIKSDTKSFFAAHFSNQEDLDKFLSECSDLAEESRNGMPSYVDDIGGLLLLVSGGLTGKFVMDWLM